MAGIRDIPIFLVGRVIALVLNNNRMKIVDSVTKDELIQQDVIDRLYFNEGEEEKKWEKITGSIAALE